MSLNCKQINLSLIVYHLTHFWNWFILNHQIHSYNTTSRTTVILDTNFEVESVTKTNILHTQCSKLVNYGAKILKVCGPLLWNRLPEHIRNTASIFTLKKGLKIFYLNQYDTSPIPIQNHYYVSKLSLCLMRLSLTKIYSLFVLNYLPAHIPHVRNISKDGTNLKIFWNIS